ncbi:MAG TPA: hypothetical protein VK142_07905 [Bacillota bacterium]|nr:hypothetical protein [Bacillota bacterium]
MAEQKKQGFFEGAFGRLVLPGVVIQSTLIAGGYATGREVVEYGAKFGAIGWVTGLTVLIGFALMAFLMFEVARVFRAFDYKSLVKEFLGPLWFLYDIIYFLLAILIISIVIAATGSILETTLGLNFWVGVILITIITAVLNFYGSHLIERFKTVGTTLLFTGYIIFAIMVISQTWGDAKEVFATGDTSFAGDFAWWSLIVTGIVYVSYNLAVYPAALFTVKRQRSIKDTLISGLIAGILMTVPWFLTYFAMMGHYPDESILGADVPWLEMMSGFGFWVTVIFGLVVGWTFIETATGMIYAFVERVENNLEESGKKPMTGKMRGLIAIIGLGLSAILSSVGIQDLVSTGYTILGWAMLIIYGIPILVIGSYRIFKATQRRKNQEL